MGSPFLRGGSIPFHTYIQQVHEKTTIHRYQLKEGTKFLPTQCCKPEVRADLQKPADYLWDLPDDYQHFDMQAFFDFENLEEDSLQGEIVLQPSTKCGYVACVVGHAPFAGVNVADCYDYENIADRLTKGKDEVFAWLFSGDRFYSDNTTKGAAARIYIYLDHGVPICPLSKASLEDYLCYEVNNPKT